MSEHEASSALTPTPKPRRGRRKADAEHVVESAAPVTAGPLLLNPVQPLLLASELGIDHASTLREQLHARLDDAGAVVLDAGEVQRIHTAAMQLFCLFCSDRRSAGREVTWLRPSPALRSAAALLGITTLLQIAGEPA